MNRMPRVRMAAVALACALAAAGAPARAAVAEGKADAIARVERYLNGLTTLRADFLQHAENGGVSAGTLYLARPGRLRIEYEPPPHVVMVSDGDWLTYIDKELGQVSQMPLSETPASVLVRENIRLGGDIAVDAVEREGALLRLRLRRADDPAAGSLTLVFTERPFDLRQWIVVDPQGLTTRVTLYNTEKGVALAPELFAAPAPLPPSERGR